MSWRDRLLPASFRGIAFYVDRAQSDFGRRVVTHEFADRDTPYSEDLGRSAKSFVISGYLIGDDYLEQRDRLLSACENQSGSGELIHPYYGSVRVNCIRVQTSDSNQELNMLRLGMTFVESGGEINPGELTSRKFELVEKKLNALDMVKAELKEKFDIAQIPINKVNEIRNMISDGLSLIEDTRLIVATAASYRRVLLQAKEDVEDLLNNVDGIADTFVDLLSFGTFAEGQFPSDQADEFQIENEDVPITSDNAVDQLNEFGSLIDFNPDSSTDSSEALKDFFIQSSAIMAAGIVSTIEYDSIDQAEEFRDLVTGYLNNLLSDAEISVELQDAVSSLKATAISEINGRAITLSRLAEITLNETKPALVLSYELYGNLDQEQDLIDRNGVEHPGFVPAGTPIEVLIDV